MAHELIACCGLNCAVCPGYLASRSNDKARAEAVAQEWTQTYKVEVKVEHVWCDGCTQSGRKCAHCGDCEIRACALDNKVDNCARCVDFSSCKMIGDFISRVPPAKANLERLRERG